LMISIVSTYPPMQCGVAYYTEKLVSSLKSLDKSLEISVVTDNLVSSDFAYPFRILRMLLRTKPSIIHFQHEYLMYGFYGIPLVFILLVLRILRYPVVVTLHTVIPLQTMNEDFFLRYGLTFLPRRVKKIGVLAFTRIICMLSCKITVHTNSCRRVLHNEYKVDDAKLVVVPHGIDLVTKIQRDRAKGILNLDGRKILLCIGFIKPDKGHDTAIKALKSQDFADHVLIIAGAIPFRHTRSEIEYVESLHRLVRQLDLQQRVVFIEHFLSEEEMRLLFSAADIVWLPYRLETCGASGIYSMARAYGNKTITSGVDRFDNSSNSDWSTVANELYRIYLELGLGRAVS